MVTLLEHNQKAMEAIQEGLKTANRVCVCNTTGSGKAFIALKYIENIKADHPEANVLYVTSYNTNLGEFQERASKMLDNQEGVYYAIYANIKNDQLPPFRAIILDEFHRAGAAGWGEKVQQLIEDNPEAKVLGLSATPIRYLDEGRNMAKELFHNNVVFELSLHDAIVQNILPCPHYTTCLYHLDDMLEEYNHKKKLGQVADMARYKELLDKAKREFQNAQGIERVFKEKLDYPKGKYIVFCRNKAHMRQMIKESKEWFSYLPKQPAVYELYASQKCAKNYKNFVNDKEDGLRLLFCINMLNEGPHIPDIDGAILLRPTESMNIYLQQIGRVLSASATKRPQIIDVVDNTVLMRPAVQMWSEITNSYIAENELNIKPNVLFDVSAEEIEIIKMLHELDDMSFSITLTWDEWYGLAKEYAQKHGGLNCSIHQKVIYTKEDGKSYSLLLGNWIARQRKSKESLTDEQIMLLNEIGMVWNVNESLWSKGYYYAKQYFEEHGNLLVKQRYVTKDGFQLGNWIGANRVNYRANALSEERIKLLESIGMAWDSMEVKWRTGYDHAKAYFLENHHLDVPAEYCCEDGYPLGQWISRQRRRLKKDLQLPEKDRLLRKDQIELLNQIGMSWSMIEQYFERGLAHIKKYYLSHGHIRIPQSYNDPDDGYRVGDFLSKQRKKYAKGELTKKQIACLEQMNIVWDARKDKEYKGYLEAEKYYKENGNLRVSSKYVTEEGYALGNFLVGVRMQHKKGKLSSEKTKMLDAIGMIWSAMAS